MPLPGRRVFYSVTVLIHSLALTYGRRPVVTMSPLTCGRGGVRVDRYHHMSVYSSGSIPQHVL